MFHLQGSAALEKADMNIVALDKLVAHKHRV
jgi:hypothetical protein